MATVCAPGGPLISPGQPGDAPEATLAERLCQPERRGQQQAQKLTVAQEVDTHQLRHREDPLGVTHVLHDLVKEETEIRSPVG